MFCSSYILRDSYQVQVSKSLVFCKFHITNLHGVIRWLLSVECSPLIHMLMRTYCEVGCYSKSCQVRDRWYYATFVASLIAGDLTSGAQWMFCVISTHYTVALVIYFFPANAHRRLAYFLLKNEFLAYPLVVQPRRVHRASSSSHSERAHP